MKTPTVFDTGTCLATITPPHGLLARFALSTWNVMVVSGAARYGQRYCLGHFGLI